MRVSAQKKLESCFALLKKLKEYINEEMLIKGFYASDSDSYAYKDLPLWQIVANAHQEWEQAQSYFNEVSDPDLIDHAIYAMQAAERKYMYLLKLANKEKVPDQIKILEN